MAQSPFAAFAEAPVRWSAGRGASGSWGMAALRNRQLKQLQTLLVDLLGPVVLVGDLNTTPWSQHFAQLLSEPRFRSVREGFGWLPTWPAMLPPFLRIPIDHCLVTSELDVLALDLGHNVGSDHLPLVVTLAL